MSNNELELQRQLQRINHNAAFISSVARKELPITIESVGDKLTATAGIKVPDMDLAQFVEKQQEITPQLLAELEMAAENTIAQSRQQYEVAKRLLEEIEIVRQRIKVERAKITVEL